MSSGSITNPKNVYHLEIVFDSEANAEQVKQILEQSDIETKLLNREKKNILYMKDGENISNFLAFVGANKSVLDFEDERVYEEWSAKR